MSPKEKIDRGSMYNLLFSDEKGNIHMHPRLEAVGMKAGNFFKLNRRDFIKLPRGSQIFKLPGRAAIGYDPLAKSFTALDKYYAVAGFVSPGFTSTYNSAYKKLRGAERLPLFSYGAISGYRGEYYTAAIRVDKDPRHDTTLINIQEVRENIKNLRKIFPANRLVRHLETCALKYGCAGAQNFFLGRYEGPLPTSPLCNASCAGCISHRTAGSSAGTQPRIKFIPSPEEVSEAALFHIGRVKDTVVSFGQGCEGEPLMAGAVIERSIRLIRKATSKGTINMNTNASKPEVLKRLLDAGLDSIRVSLNSAREEYYTRYYKPSGYSFKDVLRSIRLAKSKRAFVSINYLVMPGFMDSKKEFLAFRRLIKDNKIDMIQWRNLNFDPIRYFNVLKVRVSTSEMIGVREVIASLKQKFPKIKMGYFNPA